jgi:transcriptional regulator with XRE-family HTH domain
MKDNVSENSVRLLVSNNLKRLRALQNLSQLGLAVQAGLTHNFINDIENCKKGISAKTIAKISVALKVEPHQLFLPDAMQDDKMYLYVNDLNDSLQKVVKDLTAKYTPPEQKK